MESAIVASDKGSTTLVVRKPDTKVMYYGYSMTDGMLHNASIAKGGTPLPPPAPRARKGERKRKPSYGMKKTAYLPSTITEACHATSMTPLASAQ